MTRRTNDVAALIEQIARERIDLLNWLQMRGFCSPEDAADRGIEGPEGLRYCTLEKLIAVRRKLAV